MPVGTILVYFWHCQGRRKRDQSHVACIVAAMRYGCYQGTVSSAPRKVSVMDKLTPPKSSMLPKRGSKLCPSCGSSSGNRAYACTGYHRRLYSDPSRTGTPTKECSKQWCDVSCMTSGDDSGPHRLCSVRVRERDRTTGLLLPLTLVGRGRATMRAAGQPKKLD